MERQLWKPSQKIIDLALKEFFEKNKRFERHCGNCMFGLSNSEKGCPYKPKSVKENGIKYLVNTCSARKEKI